MVNTLRSISQSIFYNAVVATQILDAYTYDPVAQKWQATFCFTVCDHYGLDRDEV
jgi:hypothetical protein